ncbi:MAG: 4Fe-4S binding protein, partial [Vulcanimicrobiota bacterium]
MKVKFISIARRIIQVITAVLINSAPDYFNTGKIYKGPQKQFCVPFLNCQNCPTARTSCPIHFIQNVLTRHKNEGVNISVYGFILVGAIIMMVGRAPCAWLCPFGLFQDLLARINRKKFSLPRWAYKIRYFVLGFLVIGLPFLTGFHWYSKICPSGTLTSKAPWIIVHPPF